MAVLLSPAKLIFYETGFVQSCQVFRGGRAYILLGWDMLVELIFIHLNLKLNQSNPLLQLVQLIERGVVLLGARLQQRGSITELKGQIFTLPDVLPQNCYFLFWLGTLLLLVGAQLNSLHLFSLFLPWFSIELVDFFFGRVERNLVELRD